MSSYQHQYWIHGIRYRDPSHPVVQAYIYPKVEYICSKVTLEPNMRILDVGAGNGFFTYYLSEYAQVFGIDSSPHLLQRNPCRGRLVLGDGTQLPFPDEAFDVVLCACLLHHILDPPLAVRELCRASRRYVIIVEPNRANPAQYLFSLLVSEERGGLKFSRSYLRSLADGAGLHIVACEAMGMIVPNKTPRWLVPAFKVFDRPFALGINSVLIAEKR